LGLTFRSKMVLLISAAFLPVYLNSMPSTPTHGVLGPLLRARLRSLPHTVAPTAIRGHYSASAIHALPFGFISETSSFGLSQSNKPQPRYLDSLRVFRLPASLARLWSFHSCDSVFVVLMQSFPRPHFTHSHFLSYPHRSHFAPCSRSPRRRVSVLGLRPGTFALPA